MNNNKEILSVGTELELLEVITRAYAEIASLRMKKTRDFVLNARNYLQKLQELFDDIRFSYVEEVARLVRKKGSKGKEEITFLSHNGKSVVVLLSANTGLYGDIVRKTFHLFLEEVSKNESEVTIIGKQGLLLFQSFQPKVSYTYFDLPDHGFTEEAVSKIIRHIVKYKEIRLFYGQFQNLLVQQPVKEIVSAQLDAELKESGVKRQKYIFEPSLEKILLFFETEMFASLFEQSVRESQLAKFASRILAMDQASENIKNERRRVQKERLIALHNIANKRQLNGLPAVMMSLNG